MKITIDISVNEIQKLTAVPDQTDGFNFLTEKEKHNQIDKFDQLIASMIEQCKSR